MAFTLEYTSTQREITYAMTVTAQEGSGALSIELLGADVEGTVVADGSMTLPPGGATEAARLLRQALDAIAGFEHKRVRRRAGNSHQPWTSEQDAVLREAWLAGSPVDPAAGVIRALAAERERSPAAIRARLARLGCDPDVTGRLLTEQTAELVGRDAVVPA